MDVGRLSAREVAMQKHMILGIAWLLTVGPPRSDAETPLTVDLAGEVTQTWEIDPGTYSLEITNRIPGKAYIAVANVRNIPIPALPNPFAEAPLPAPDEKKPKDPCAALQAALQDIYSPKSEESGVPLAVLKLQAASGAAAAATCDPSLLKESERAKKATTVLMPRVYVLKAGQRLEVVVTRTEPAKTWKVTFTTGPRGDWLTSYGFMFIPNRDQQFFSAPGTENDEFVITRKHDRNSLDFTPSVFFNFLRASDQEQSLVLGPTAGLGFDLEAPVVFAGGSLFYERNIALVVGAVIHQEKRLRGQYTSGQTIKENLSEDQLTEKTYRPGFFMGLSFRFSENIFRKKEEPPKEKEKAKGDEEDSQKKASDKAKKSGDSSAKTDLASPPSD
jgi:hypothetical protein